MSSSSATSASAGGSLTDNINSSFVWVAVAVVVGVVLVAWLFLRKK